MPRDHLERLVERAHSVEEREAALRKLTVAHAANLDFAEWAERATPDEKRLMSEIFAGKYREGQAPARQEPEEDLEDREPPPKPAVPPDYAQLRREVAELRALEGQRQQESRQRTQEQNVEHLMESYEVFKGDPAVRKLARRTILLDVASGGRDPASAVASAAAEYGAVIRAPRGAGGSARTAQAAAQGAPTSLTGFEGSPGGMPNWNDLTTGKVKETVLAALRARQR